MQGGFRRDPPVPACTDAGCVVTLSYRYTLTREWRGGAGTVCWVMLNPSTADDTVDDPTIRRVIRFSTDNGFRRLVVVNLFAARSTDPAELVDMAGAGCDPRGPDNNEALRAAISQSLRVIYAWGASIPRPLDRLATEQIAHVSNLTYGYGLRPGCLGVTKHGHPRHPLYVAAATPLQPFG